MATSGKPHARLARRELLAGVAARALAGAAGVLASRAARAHEASPAGLADDLRNLRVMDSSEDGRRFLLVTPRYQNPSSPVPLAVFLHGLGETTTPRLGAYAWLERYGLGSAWQRLKRAPVERTLARGDWTDARLAEVNAELAARPFRGFAVACPFMPNPRGAADLDAYARWIERSLVPRCWSEANVLSDASRTSLAGVSLGGYVALEVITRAPGLFGACAVVQTAIGRSGAVRYADAIARLERPTSMFVLTSTLDPFRAPSEAFSAALEARSIEHAFRVVPGPHDQPWLRETGTIETLLWLDRIHERRSGARLGNTVPGRNDG